MDIQQTKLTAEVCSSGELNRYLQDGWTLILAYTQHLSDSQEPRFVVAWQGEGPAIFPELLDEWERREMRRVVR